MTYQIQKLQTELRIAIQTQDYKRIDEINTLLTILKD